MAAVGGQSPVAPRALLLLLLRVLAVVVVGGAVLSLSRPALSAKQAFRHRHLQPAPAGGAAVTGTCEREAQVVDAYLHTNSGPDIGFQGDCDLLCHDQQTVASCLRGRCARHDLHADASAGGSFRADCEGLQAFNDQLHAVPCGLRIQAGYCDLGCALIPHDCERLDGDGDGDSGRDGGDETGFNWALFPLCTVAGAVFVSLTRGCECIAHEFPECRPLPPNSRREHSRREHVAHSPRTARHGLLLSLTGDTCAWWAPSQASRGSSVTTHGLRCHPPPLGEEPPRR
jgi:hypothetical protein